MKANARHHGKVTVLDLSGKITIGDGDIKLREAVNAQLEEGRKSILLNMSGVSYMDSAGIGELVACYKRATEKGASLKRPARFRISWSSRSSRRSSRSSRTSAKPSPASDPGSLARSPRPL